MYWLYLFLKYGTVKLTGIGMFINISYSLIIVLSVNKDILSQKYFNKSA